MGKICHGSPGSWSWLVSPKAVSEIKHKWLLPEVALTATCLFPEVATKRARATRRSLLHIPYGEGHGETLDIYFPEGMSEGKGRADDPWQSPARHQPQPCTLFCPVCSLACLCVFPRRILAEWKVSEGIWMNRGKGRLLSQASGCPGAPATNDHTLGAQNSEIDSESSGGQRSETRVSAGHAPSQGRVPKGRACSRLLHLLGPKVFLGLWPQHFHPAFIFLFSVCVSLKSPLLL